MRNNETDYHDDFDWRFALGLGIGSVFGLLIIIVFLT